MSSDQTVSCGDCHSLLHPESGMPERLVAGDPEKYCPRCGKSAVRAVTCQRCGSQVCSDCGSIVECATDLGFG